MPPRVSNAWSPANSRVLISLTGTLVCVHVRIVGCSLESRLILFVSMPIYWPIPLGRVHEKPLMHRSSLLMCWFCGCERWIAHRKHFSSIPRLDKIFVCAWSRLSMLIVVRYFRFREGCGQSTIQIGKQPFASIGVWCRHFFWNGHTN